MDTLYDVLKVSPDAPFEVIRAAYRALSARWHPDRNPGDPGAGRAMARLNEAYATLSDPSLRVAYDRRLAGQPEKPASWSRAEALRQYAAVDALLPKSPPR